MLELRPNCEHCGVDLPNTSTEAMICSFECTYCKTCAIEIFQNVCPSCTGNFVPRPIRPKQYVEKYPPSAEKIYKPKDLAEKMELIEFFKNIPPEKR
ncbi:DUF1272 domain-containing protein [Tenacibaculum crassostreae]|uniref:DUF1272 domain-containing protein n=1 Tax=Tenacibaculum crassostreae TaxID=502683 RepID=UPI0038949DFF